MGNSNIKEKFKTELKNFYSGINLKLIETLSNSLFDNYPPMEEFLPKILSKHKEFENTLKGILIKLIKEELSLSLNKITIKNIKTLIEITEKLIEISDKIKTSEINKLQAQIKNLKKQEYLKELEIISSLFKRLLNSPFTFLKYYKEIPVKCTGFLKRTISEHLIFEVFNCKYLIFQEEDEILIINNNLPQPVLGRVEHFNIKKEIVSIQAIKFTKIPQEKRRYLRVEPAEKVEVIIKTAKETLKGILKDISIGGIGVITEKKTKLEIGEAVFITFFLKDKEIKTNSYVKHITPINSQIRIGFEFLNEKLYEEEIAKYTIKREMEILNEIRI